MLDVAWRNRRDVPYRVGNFFCPFFVRRRKRIFSLCPATVDVAFAQYQDEFMHDVCSVILRVRIDHKRPIAVRAACHLVPDYLFMKLPLAKRHHQP